MDTYGFDIVNFEKVGHSTVSICKNWGETNLFPSDACVKFAMMDEVATDLKSCPSHGRSCSVIGSVSRP